jgi:hypothetical protein
MFSQQNSNVSCVSVTSFRWAEQLRPLPRVIPLYRPVTALDPCWTRVDNVVVWRRWQNVIFFSVSDETKREEKWSQRVPHSVPSLPTFQSSCRHRDVRGFSDVTKHWLSPLFLSQHCSKATSSFTFLAPPCSTQNDYRLESLSHVFP